MSIRLQKILSAAGVASRRAAEGLIVEGRVTVNGVTVRELGTRADPATDDIRVDQRRVRVAPARRHILLYKPAGYVSTRHDPQGRPTVIELVRRFKEDLYPVGRLDYESEGLLLLTNDGDLAARLMHPRYGIERVYEATVMGAPDAEALRRLARGVVIDGRSTAPARITRVKALADRTVLEIALSEGRNRQVRKMCDAIGHPVQTLRRIRIGPLMDPRLGPGDYRELTPEEVERLRAATVSGGQPPDTRRDGV